MQNEIKHQLKQFVSEFQTWLQKTYPGKKLYEDFTDDEGYPNWNPIEFLFGELLKENKLSKLDDEDRRHLLYLIARNNEGGRMLAHFSNNDELSNLGKLSKEDFIVLSRTVSKLSQPEYRDAQDQFAALFEKFDSLTGEIQEILLEFFMSGQEYTSRRALCSLAKLNYPETGSLVEAYWTRPVDDEEHKKMACLFVIDEYLDDFDMLQKYIALCKEDDGPYLHNCINELINNQRRKPRLRAIKKHISEKNLSRIQNNQKWYFVFYKLRDWKIPFEMKTLLSQEIKTGSVAKLENKSVLTDGQEYFTEFYEIEFLTVHKTAQLTGYLERSNIEFIEAENEIKIPAYR
ncbi:MAG: hypothetical protein IAF38_21190 [Bacteroidia bacterium]|nr:hypothetical protein [Bacteroidia bacterium]